MNKYTYIPTEIPKALTRDGWKSVGRKAPILTTNRIPVGGLIRPLPKVDGSKPRTLYFGGDPDS